MINEHDISDMCTIADIKPLDFFKIEDKEYQVRNIYNDVAFVYDEFGFIHKFAASLKVKKI